MKNTLVVLREVLKQPRYFILFIVLSVVSVFIVAISTHISLFNQVIFSQTVTLAEKIVFSVTLLGVFKSSFSLISAILTIMTLILFSLNICLLTYYIRRRKSVFGRKRAHTAGFFGLISGFFGVGCAACGSVIASSILSAVGAGGLLALLPLHGAEFGLLSVGLLVFSVYEIAKHVNDPLTCSV